MKIEPKHLSNEALNDCSKRQAAKTNWGKVKSYVQHILWVSRDDCPELYLQQFMLSVWFHLHSMPSEVRCKMKKVPTLYLKINDSCKVPYDINLLLVSYY